MQDRKIAGLKKFIQEYPFPTDILVETISNCNLNCIMCPQDSLTREQGRMPFPLWKKIIDEVTKKSPETRIWPALMGEPLLLGKDLFKFVRYASQQKIRLHLNTNLRAFKREMAADILSCGLSEILIGIDGASKESYEAIRKKGNYKKLVTDIMFLLNERKKIGESTPIITLQFIEMQENLNEKEKFISFWKQHGNGIRLKIKPRTGWANSVDTWYGRRTRKPGDRMPCTWLLRQMTVMWNGDVPHCDGDWNGEFITGNVNDSSLESIWTGSLKKFREKHMVHDFNYAPCVGCEDWYAGLSQWVDVD